MKELIYGDKIIRMEGVIVEIHDGCVGIDLKGRLGYLKIPMRMLTTYKRHQEEMRKADAENKEVEE